MSEDNDMTGADDGDYDDELPNKAPRFDMPLPEPNATPMPSDTRAGFIALIGAPNAGKSTLINQLVGTKVSIVTHKVQTTRAIVRGIAMHGKSQLVFVDTPGIFQPKRRLDRAMVDTAWGGARDADVIALLIDARKGIDEEAEAIMQRLEGIQTPKVLILNKIDVAFSRDQPEKVYVQDRMRDSAAELYEWLEKGAYFYVCGDASRMASDVHDALIEVIQTQGGKTPEEATAYVDALKKDKRYQRDVY